MIHTIYCIVNNVLKLPSPFAFWFNPVPQHKPLICHMSLILSDIVTIYIYIYIYCIYVSIVMQMILFP